MSTTATTTDEMLMLAEVLGEVKARTDKLETELFTQTRPLEAALAGLAALKHHVLDNSITVLSARIEEHRGTIGKQIEGVVEELKKADNQGAAALTDATKSLRTELAGLSQQLGAIDTQLAAEVHRVEQLARVPGPASPGINGAGAWDDDKTYMKGDVVSYLGGSFLSNFDNNEEKPGAKAKKWTQLVGRAVSYSTGPTEGGGSGTISFVSVPATATSSGTAGQVAVSAFHLYICTATNTWRRCAIGSW